MADKVDLDERDRKNLYRATADNIHVVEVSHVDLRNAIGAIGIEEIDDAFDEAQGQVLSQNEDRSYIVIKVVR